MADLNVKTIDDEQKFVYEKTISAAGDHIAEFATENTFLDKDIRIEITTPSAAAPALDVTDITTNIVMGSATNGVYEPTATIEGNVSVATAGWITTGNKAVSESGVKIGKVNQSVLKNGNTAISSGDDVVPAVSDDQTINITEGYNTARTVVVKSMDSSDTQKATVNSANLSIGTSDLTIAFDSENSEFDITGSKTISAPSVQTAGFISSTAGTKNTGTATISASLDEITVGVTPSTTTQKVTPVIARTAKDSGDTWVDAASGAATTTKPSAGAYVQVDAAAVAASVTATGKVSAAGYGDTTNYNADTATTISVGSNAAASAYVPIAAGTVASGTAEISSVSVAYDSTAGNFDVTGAANIPAPTASAAGYVGNGVGTLSGATNGATVDASIAKIGISATISGGSAVTPVISKNAATNVTASAATTSQPASGFYVAVGSAADSSSVTAAAAVTSAGYGTTTSGQYTTVGDSATVTVNASDVTYVPIQSGSLANSATSQVTYTDLSSSAPIVPSEGYLYINEGYYANSKVSLARLVPDDATITYASGAGYMLDGQSAYDSDGKLVVGTIPTYTGAYSVVA